MAKLKKIDSNVTGLRYAEEVSLGVLPGSPIWVPLEPNSYSDFGGEISTVARNPINPTRQRKKGVTTDLSASGGISQDITQKNIQNMMQGFLFADLRIKAEQDVTTISATSEYNVADETGIAVGSLVYASGFADAANNGLKNVSAVAAGVVTVSETLVNDGSPTAGANIVVVGVTGAAGDIDVDSTGTLPAITSTTLDFTTLGLTVGEWIYVGGDSASTAFSTAANNGFARISSILANRVEFDKTEDTMVTEASTTETVQLFFGRVLKNEVGTLIKRRSYQLERSLGAPDDAAPGDIQSEYVVGAVPSELTFNLPSADKVTLDLSFVGTDVEQRDSTTGLKAGGTRPDLVEADAFNTSSDFSRIKLAKVVAGDPAPVDLFAFAEEMTITLTNNLSPNKALGVLGSFEITAGTFEVGGSMTAYFADNVAAQAIRDNNDLTFDIHMVKQNSGITVDLPLVSLGDGRPNVEQDQPIKLPLGMEASTGAKISGDLDHTMLFMFWDYLPTAADS
jgi:hypothetical protein